MAAKTLILRPISVRATDNSLVTLYPSDTTMENAHTLVDEETHDDDATYVANSLGADVYYNFEFIKPADLYQVTNIQLCVMTKLEPGTSNTGVGTYYFVYDLDEFVFSAGSLNTSSYVNVVEAGLAETNVTTALEYINSNSGLTFAIRHKTGTTGKANPTRVTQVYTQLTYESLDPVEPDLEEFYIKKNGAWSKIAHKAIYLKTNSQWVLSDSSVMQNNQKYIIKEV